MLVSDLMVSIGMIFFFWLIIYEMIRNIYFYVVLWLFMMLLFIVVVVYSVCYVCNFFLEWDSKVCVYIFVGFFFGILGLVMGMVWVKYIWG